jgi:Flp pilus assembly protein TadG
MTPPSGQRARARSRPPDGRTSRARHRGQALVELALILPVLLFLLLGALDLGRVFYSKIAVTDAAKEGALVASQGASASVISTAVITEAEGGLVEIDAANVASTACPGDPDGATPPATVTVEAPFHAITPFVSSVLGGNDVMIGATATARCRYTPPFAGTPFPTPSPTPTPACLIVPDLKNPAPETVGQARTEWAAAGFTGAFSPSGQNSKIVSGQNQAPGACLPATTSVTVTHS